MEAWKRSSESELKNIEKVTFPLPLLHVFWRVDREYFFSVEPEKHKKNVRKKRVKKKRYKKK